MLCKVLIEDFFILASLDSGLAIRKKTLTIRKLIATRNLTITGKSDLAIPFAQTNRQTGRQTRRVDAAAVAACASLSAGRNLGGK